jgi:hypothetical protein
MNKQFKAIVEKHPGIGGRTPLLIERFVDTVVGLPGVISFSPQELVLFRNGIRSTL